MRATVDVEFLRFVLERFPDDGVDGRVQPVEFFLQVFGDPWPCVLVDV